MKALLDKQTEKSDEVLRAIAHMPTKSLPILMDNDFMCGLTDADFMRVGVFLAQKSKALSFTPDSALKSLTRIWKIGKV